MEKGGTDLVVKVRVASQQIAKVENAPRDDEYKEYVMNFNMTKYVDKLRLLAEKIKQAEKAVRLSKGIGRDELVQLEHRLEQLETGFIVGPYLLVKCGNEIKYRKIETTSENEELSHNDTEMDIIIEQENSVRNIFPTGISDLV